jgi:serine/threonine protein kinase
VGEANNERRRAEPDPLIGIVVGRYRIETVLGVGGMGTVYRAVGPEGEVVALKLVRSEFAQDRVFRRRFDREARIASSIVNPHVVPVLDTGEHEGVPYLCQRFIAGESLRQRLDREGRLAVPIALAICAEVASGLDALSAGGMIHRDVKPANVLLDTGGVAYVIDFGLAKDSQASKLTRSRQALGSFAYMAPEQIRGEQVGAATDVYGLGCVVFECLSGSAPFAGKRGMQVLFAALEDEPPDPCAELSGAPPTLGAAVVLALAKDPRDRPQSAGEYARTLHEAAGLSPPA